jgi:hypothetical protein
MHITAAYLIVAAGLLAMFSRVIPFMRPWHAFFGKLYLIFMFWAMGTALVVHNVGLALPIIISFLYLLSGITIGLPAIHFHKKRFETELWHRIQSRLSDAVDSKDNLDILEIRNQEIAALANDKTFAQRFFSLKVQ